MIDAVVAGLTSVLSMDALLMGLLGMLIGFAVGILPGLGGPATLAIMLPFTYGQDPVPAFAFLLAMTATLGTAGDITSILFGVPGEATSAATVVDGYPMTKRGEGGRALGAVLMSSLIGATIGALVLAISIPIVRPVILAFGSPEFLMLTVVGLTLVGVLSADSPLKGLVAAGVGLLLATVGLDNYTGEQRFTFGVLQLWDGFSIVPVSIGLFAVPEIVELATVRGAIAEGVPPRTAGVLRGVRDAFTHFWLTVRSSALGTLAGVMPGLGNSVGQWIAYGHAVQSSRDPTRFGRGAVEGVLAPGAANNAGLGGSLIPTLAFGVPGSVMTAILLGAFLIQGIAPGPEMLTRHLDLTMSFVWIIVITNAAAVLFSLLLIRQLVRVTRVRSPILLGPLIALVFVGAFADRSVLLDVPIMLAFGLVGLVMVKFNYPRPALILGLVLGGLVENYLFLSVQLYGVGWLGRPIVLGLLVVAAGVIAQSVRRAARLHVTKLHDSSTPGSDDQPSILRTDIIVTSAILAIVFASLVGTLGWKTEASLFPQAVGIPVLLLLIVLGWMQLRTLRPGGPSGERVLQRPDFQFLRPIAWMAGLFVAVLVVGLAVATTTGAVLYARVVGRERWVTVVILGGVLAAFYVIAATWLGLRLPPGFALDWVL